MAFEVDFLPVGDGERSGDAICIRFGSLQGTREQQTVCVVDGGTKESGEKLVEHIRQFYKTDHVDYAFCTHPDSDHASGLCVVLESLSCGTLVMHRPWEHSEEICHLFDDPNITPDKLAGRMERNLLAARNLERLAQKKKITIVEPFAGVSTTDKTIMVLGPDKDYYQSLLPTFRDMPELAAKGSVFDALAKFAGEAISWVAESMHIETLADPEPGYVSSENNSSAVILLQLDGHKLLLTGDAGCEALRRVIAFACSNNISLNDLRFLQIPHHGSRRNIGPTILNQIKAGTAFISAAAEGAPKHPSKRVTNALLRRGASVYATQGKPLLHAYPHNRPYWSAAPQIPFYYRVEDNR
jgi:beta-lactamase superfamily II metal-dependent hydrolase